MNAKTFIEIVMGADLTDFSAELVIQPEDFPGRERVLICENCDIAGMPKFIAHWSRLATVVFN